MQADVVIVGGGPAGTAAALTLCRYSALKVVVLEQGDYSELRVGETLGPGIESMLMYLGVLNRFRAMDQLPAHSTAAAWGSEEIFHQHFLFSGHGEGWHLDRNRFDKMLAEACCSAGAAVLTDAKVLSVEREHSGQWRIRARNTEGETREITAGFVIDASGRNARIARQSGAEVQVIDKLVGVMGFVPFDADLSEESFTLVESVPAGWWYSTSLPGRRLAVAFMSDADLIHDRNAAHEEEWLRLLAETQHTRLRVIGGKRPSSLVVRSAVSQQSCPAGGEGWLAAGDALAAFDPLSSMGIGHALASGAHAARVVEAALRGDILPHTQYLASAKEIMTQYLVLRHRFYAMEQRWPREAFWQRRLNKNTSF